ncbi:MAG: AsnC family transcriptional regulator [Hyphomicrobiaceae bacterium]|nr:AsnC family transcriptional regulator [Hyphomicrobiaceae bacterium]
MPRAPHAVTITLDALDRRIINRLQDGLPLTSEPFADVAAELGASQAEILERTERLLDSGVLTRFGPFFDAAAMGGAFCLCAMAVPTERFDAVAAIVNAFDEVAHNYERTHALNMWFVLATETEAGIERTARAIESETGLRVLLFPKLEEFFIGFRVAA